MEYQNTYQVTFKQGKFVGTCLEFPDIEVEAEDAISALSGIMEKFQDRTSRQGLPSPQATQEFANLMNYELMRNAHKGDWTQWAKNASEEEVNLELEQHIQKFFEVFKGGRGNCEQFAQLTEYAADIANILMFIIYRWRVKC